MIFYQQGEEEHSQSPTKQLHGSPVKTVLSTLQKNRGGGPAKGGKGTSFKVHGISYEMIKLFTLF